MGRLKNGIRIDNVDPKVCTKCNISKSLSEYHYEKDRDRYRGECRSCRNITRRSHYPKVKDKINAKCRDRWVNEPGYAERQKNTSAKSRKKHGWKYKERQKKLYWENPELYRQRGRDFTANMTDEQREKRSTSAKIYQEKNKDKIDKQKKKYYIENKESISEKSKKYIKDNPEHCKKLRKANYLKHQDKNINDQKNLRDERRKLLREKLGGKCVGYNKVCGSTKKLEFDHIEPENKSFSIGQCLSKPLDLLLEESEKCQLLCYKCHYEKTRDEWISGKLQIKVKKTKLKNKTL